MAEFSYETSFNTVHLQWSPKVAANFSVVGEEGGYQQDKAVEEGVGKACFAMLLCSREYVVNVNGQILKIQTQASPFASILKEGDHLRIFVTQHHRSFEWVHEPCLPDTLIALPDLLLHTSAVDALFKEACFILCSETPSWLVTLPNPRKRFCLDLRSPIRWDLSKKMRGAGVEGLRLTMDYNFRQSLMLAGQQHFRRCDVTWVTEELVEFLDSMHRRNNDPGREVKHHSFELWDGNEIVAVSLGYHLGCTWHDYTHAALRRDDRGFGTILTKSVGHLLQASGVQFWYWGIVQEGTSYMYDYKKYGGRDFPRSEFVPLWHDLAGRTLPSHPSIELANGKSLIQRKESQKVREVVTKG